MIGKGEQICKGLEVFSQRSKDSMKNITLGVKDELDASLQERLSNAITLSSPTLRAFSIDHQGDLCKLIVDVGGQCNNLVVLRSGREGEESNIYPPDEDHEALEFPSSWKAPLKTLDWKSGDESLVCTDALLERLRGARQAIISSTEHISAWIVKLLSSSSRLEKVHLRTEKATQVDNIPPVNLPNFVHLYLDSSPRSTQTGDSSLFFKNLDAPRLEGLQVDRLKPRDLTFLCTTSSLEELLLSDLPVTDSASAKAAASALIESIKDWSKLSHLGFQLPFL